MPHQKDPDAEARADRSFTGACIAIGIGLAFALAFALATWAVGSAVHNLHRPQVNVVANSSSK